MLLKNPAHCRSRKSLCLPPLVGQARLAIVMRSSSFPISTKLPRCAIRFACCAHASFSSFLGFGCESFLFNILHLDLVSLGFLNTRAGLRRWLIFRVQKANRAAVVLVNGSAFVHSLCKVSLNIAVVTFHFRTESDELFHEDQICSRPVLNHVISPLGSRANFGGAGCGRG